MAETFNRRGVLGLAAGAALAGCNPASRKPLPDMTDLPAVAGLTTAMGSPLPGLQGPVFRRTALVLNVWASWCPYCRGEHGLLMKLAQNPNMTLIGIVFRDHPEPVRDYLRKDGNPYRALGMDRNGWVAQHLGQRGVPSTYVVDASGRIIESFLGSLTAERVETSLRPAYERAKSSV